MTNETKPTKNYIPGSMSFSAGFYGPRGDVGFLMMYSHEKAVEIIKNLLLKGRQIAYANAGLDGDWHENNSLIYDEGGFHSYTAHDGSTWAQPILIVSFEDGPSEMYEVWVRREKT